MPKELLKWTDLVYEKQDWWLLEPLKQLNLSQNELTSFDATEEQLKMLAHQLHRCNLAHNAFQSIPAKVCSVSRLEPMIISSFWSIVRSSLTWTCNTTTSPKSQNPSTSAPTSLT